MGSVVEQQKLHLAKLLEAVQRCAWFLHQSQNKIAWPLDSQFLKQNHKNVDLFETLSAINERFAKLQDTLASTMRHGALLMSEPADSFLRVLACMQNQLGITPESDTFSHEFASLPVR
jgi:hypothetical protein